MSDDRHVPLGDRGYEFLTDESLEQADDPQFAQWLAREAKGVNAPGATPHAEMWAAIAAAQPAAAAAATSARVLPFRSRRWAGAALLAAALLIGIGVDRLLLRAPDVPTTATPAARVASSTTSATPESTAVAVSSAHGVTAPATGSTLVASTAAGKTTGASASTRSIPTATARQASTSSSAPIDGTSQPAPAAAPPTGNLYRLAAVQTLSQAEALLTAYRASGVAERDPAAARQLARWGRDVLSSTRLLLDSPAGDDPEMRPLLNDLELVLVQIIRLSGAPLDASERTLIERSLRERDLLPRIHTAVPAGTTGAFGTASDD